MSKSHITQILLTDEEQKILDLLAKAHLMFLDLHVQHYRDRSTFTDYINQAATLVMVRAVIRAQARPDRLIRPDWE